jgi:hypothetical protein
VLPSHAALLAGTASERRAKAGVPGEGLERGADSLDARAATLRGFDSWTAVDPDASDAEILTLVVQARCSGRIGNSKLEFTANSPAYR